MELKDAKEQADRLNNKTLEALQQIHKAYADGMRDVIVLFHKRCMGADEEPKLTDYIEKNLISWPYKAHKDYKSKWL